MALTDSQKFHRERWLCSFCRELQDVIHVPWVDTPLLAIAEKPAAPDGPRRPVQPRS